MSLCTLRVSQLEDFEKVRVLGVGGAGIVHELLHKTSGARYALKEMEIKNKTQMKVTARGVGWRHCC
jgi:hypothetical protein